MFEDVLTRDSSELRERAAALVERLVDALPQASIPELFNPYRDQCELDTNAQAAEARRARLVEHLACEPRWILVGEAPGYQGCRYTGVAFTSEKQVLAGAVPRVLAPIERLTRRELPFSEPSATLVWKALYCLGIAEATITWNALQLHPVGPRGPWSNRTPSPAELAAGAPALRLLLAAFPAAGVVAVGRHAQALLAEAGARGVAGAVRHPANGGARAFAEGLAALVARGAR